jgi:hypothetical protein
MPTGQGPKAPPSDYGGLTGRGQNLEVATDQIYSAAARLAAPMGCYVTGIWGPSQKVPLGNPVLAEAPALLGSEADALESPATHHPSRPKVHYSPNVRPALASAARLTAIHLTVVDPEPRWQGALSVLGG